MRWIPLLLAFLPGAVCAQDEVAAAVRRGLKDLGLAVKDLHPRHDFLPADAWRLPLVERYLSRPLEVRSDCLRRFRPWLGGGTLVEGLVRAGTTLGYKVPAKIPRPQSVAMELKGVPRAARPFLLRLLGALEHAVRERREAFSKLTDAEWVHLRKFGSQFDTGMPAHLRAPLLRTHHARIDVERIFRAALVVAAVLDGLPRLRAALGKQRPEFHLRAGRVEIGGWGRDVYEKDALLTFDFGGDDEYRNSAGGTLYLPGKVSVCVDLDGDDVYRTDVGLAQGSGMYGIGILVDCGGDDSYESKNVSQGAGHAGVGVLWDWAGDDRYRARAVSQGAGFQGVGLLRDDAGRDVYRLGVQGQGYGGVQGFGILADGAGDDSYRAGGLVADAPREPDRFLSMAQGFGLGVRAAQEHLCISGGIGLLADAAGDDSYEADVFGQGCAYWYAAGVLLDGAGRDFHEVHNYGQGAGIHMAVGIQMDFAGDDRYVGRGHALGHALDRSFGLFVDLTGNDLYESRDGESQGAAVKPFAVGVFLDLEGDDTYRGGGNGHVRPPERGREEERPKAFFLDGAGRDAYGAGKAGNARRWTSNRYGWGADR